METTMERRWGHRAPSKVIMTTDYKALIEALRIVDRAIGTTQVTVDMKLKRIWSYLYCQMDEETSDTYWTYRRLGL